MPEKSHNRPQVTIDNGEYQELLEAQRALEHLMKGKEGETKVIHQYTDYHSKSHHDKRDFYLVVNPDVLTEKLIEHLTENTAKMTRISDAIGSEFSIQGARNYGEILSKIYDVVRPKTK
jgi:hypothetical protein